MYKGGPSGGVWTELKGITEEAWEVEKESMIILSKKRTGNFSQC